LTGAQVNAGFPFEILLKTGFRIKPFCLFASSPGNEALILLCCSPYITDHLSGLLNCHADTNEDKIGEIHALNSNS
jgi:hypothetical protein